MKNPQTPWLFVFTLILAISGCEIPEAPVTGNDEENAVQAANLLAPPAPRIYTFEASLGTTAKNYILANTDWSVTARLITASAIAAANNPKKANLTKVAHWVTSKIPDPNSTALITVDWEEPFAQLQSQDSATYLPLVREYVKVVLKIKKMRPQATVGVYGLPFAPYTPEEVAFNRPAGKFGPIFKAADLIHPELYLTYPETYAQTADPHLNERFLTTSLRIALQEGINQQKPVLPFFWYRITTLSKQPEKGYFWDPETFARFAHILLTHEVNGVRANGLVLWDQQRNRAEATSPGVTAPGSTASWVADPKSTEEYDKIVIQEVQALEAARMNLDVNLTFGAHEERTLADKNGVGTGFTVVNAFSGQRLAADGAPTYATAPEYEPAHLTIRAGKLQLLTNKGIAHLSSNNQLNALGIPVNGKNQLQLETTLIKPFYGTASQQAGLWLGPNDQTYLKLVVTGNKIELRKEVNDVSGSKDQRITAFISGLNQQTVYLRLVVDPVTQTATGFYSTTGITYTPVGTAPTPPGLIISDLRVSSAPIYAGIFATHRNAAAPVTYTFDNFKVLY